MRKILLSSAALLFLSVASANAQVICCAPPPPVGGGATAATSGASGGQFAAYGVLGAATYLAVLNPRRGSDSIFANTFYGEWACARRDKRSKCDTFVRLSLREQNRLRRAAGLPPH